MRSSDIVPKFGAPRKSSKSKVMYELASLPGATVEFIPNDPTKPHLTGSAALAMLDPPEARRSSGTLDSGDRPERPRRPATLGGD